MSMSTQLFSNNWFWQIVIVSIPGVINVWLSSAEQARRFREFPLFQSWKSPRLWWVKLIQLALPVALFIWVAPEVFQIPPLCSTTPSAPDTCQLRAIDLALVGNALAFGWGFVALLNAPISILSAGMMDAGPIYDLLIDRVYEKIYSDQRVKMLDFWQQIETEIAQTPSFSAQGINTLSEVLGIPSYLLNEASPNVDAVTLTRLNKIKALQDPALSRQEQARQIVALLRTEDVVISEAWQKLVRDFGCREDKVPTLFRS